LIIISVVVAVLTFVVPAGQYDYVDGQPVPGTYHPVEPSPQRLRDAIAAPINGMYGIQDETGNINIYNSGDLYGAIDVALFILLIGGFLGVTMKTGAIDAGIAAVVRSLGQRGRVLITVLMVIFAAGGTFYGMAEESLAFYPLIIAAMIALGYDVLSAVASSRSGAASGQSDDHQPRSTDATASPHSAPRWASSADHHPGGGAALGTGMSCATRRGSRRIRPNRPWLT
jgi:uncharacterized ion transporter superfamily protein YfcC